MMSATFKLQYLILIGVLYFKFSFSYPHNLIYNGVKIATYGEPCHSPRYLPITIEEPVQPITELELPEPCVYKPLKLNYRVISDKPTVYQSQAEYPISIQVPIEVPQPLEIITPDPLRGKSYVYNTQALPLPSVPTSTSYNFDLQVPPSQYLKVTMQEPIKYLTGLTSRIDKILIPACKTPLCNCRT